MKERRGDRTPADRIAIHDTGSVWALPVLAFDRWSAAEIGTHPGRKHMLHRHDTATLRRFVSSALAGALACAGFVALGQASSAPPAGGRTHAARPGRHPRRHL